MPTTGAPPSPAGVYSLGDEEEEELASPEAAGVAATAGAAASGEERAQWAAQLGLLALQAGVVLGAEVRRMGVQLVANSSVVGFDGVLVFHADEPDRRPGLVGRYTHPAGSP